MLHTHYYNRRRLDSEEIALTDARDENRIEVKVCAGTSCFIRGSQKLLHELIHHVEENSLQNRVDVRANFCSENCSHGPTVMIGEKKLSHCTFEMARDTLHEELKNQA
ncbi:MAG: NADP-reducing hydrogenase subunit HndA [Planctomycetes bacterium ADurb.Bin412]|nr:MAG: NADP-reducing hydrogenase subunit HndA [Planctomycetes bacterium ADurb.Bin412]